MEAETVITHDYSDTYVFSSGACVSSFRVSESCHRIESREISPVREVTLRFRKCRKWEAQLAALIVA